MQDVAALEPDKTMEILSMYHRLMLQPFSNRVKPPLNSPDHSMTERDQLDYIREWIVEAEKPQNTMQICEQKDPHHG